MGRVDQQDPQKRNADPHTHKRTPGTIAETQGRSHGHAERTKQVPDFKVFVGGHYHGVKVTHKAHFVSGPTRQTTGGPTPSQTCETLVVHVSHE